MVESVCFKLGNFDDNFEHHFFRQKSSHIFFLSPEQQPVKTPRPRLDPNVRST